MDLVSLFDTLSTAPGGAEKLRGLVLKLAMKGRLVEQNPSETPAYRLLEDIRKQRALRASIARLGAQGEQIESSEGLYQLPQGWVWARLGALGRVFNGNSINASEKEARYTGVSGRPYIATKDVGYGLDPLDYDNGVRIPETESTFRVARAGAVLMCAEGGSAGKKCGVTDRDICFGNKLFAIELDGGIPSKFLLYYYKSEFFRSVFQGALSGIIGGVSIAKFVELPVPIPPLQEQLRLVAKLDELMSLCNSFESVVEARDQTLVELNRAALRELLISTDEKTFERRRELLSSNFLQLSTRSDNVEELKQSILQLAVMGRLTSRDAGDESSADVVRGASEERKRLGLRPVANTIGSKTPLGYAVPDTWAWVSLEHVLVYGPTNGFSPRAVDFKTDVRSLTLSATTSGVFKGEHSKFVDVDVPADSELWLRDGDILVQRGNTLEYVGVPAIYRGPSGNFIYPDLMMKLRFSSAVDSEYVYYVMSSKPSRDYLRARASGTSGTMPKINQATLRSLPIPIPPLGEQRRIVAVVKQLMERCGSLVGLIESVELKKAQLADAAIAQV